MKLDVQRLDDRIKKLQEIRRIAADPELVSILLEFVLFEDAGPAASQTAATGNGVQSRQDDVEGLIKNELLKETASAPAHGGGSIWGVRRG